MKPNNANLKSEGAICRVIDAHLRERMVPGGPSKGDTGVGVHVSGSSRRLEESSYCSAIVVSSVEWFQANQDLPGVHVVRHAANDEHVLRSPESSRSLLRFEASFEATSFRFLLFFQMEKSNEN